MLQINEKRFVYVLSNIDAIIDEIRSSGGDPYEVIEDDGSKIHMNSILNDQESIDHAYNTPLIYECTFGYLLPSNYFEDELWVMTSCGIVTKIPTEKLKDNEFIFNLNKTMLVKLRDEYYNQSSVLNKQLYNILSGETRPIIYSPAMYGGYENSGVFPHTPEDMNNTTVVEETIDVEGKVKEE